MFFQVRAIVNVAVDNLDPWRNRKWPRAGADFYSAAAVKELCRDFSPGLFDLAASSPLTSSIVSATAEVYRKS
jgi:hypothetical protein